MRNLARDNKDEKKMVISNLNKKKKLYLFSFILGVMSIAFIAGILLGMIIANPTLDEISKFLKDNELDSESFLIEQDLLKNFGKEECSLAQTRLTSLSEELGSIGRQLSEPDIEKRLEKENYRYLKIKYHLLQIRTYLFFKKIRDKCNAPVDVVLFYYNDNADSLEQGYILDELVKENPSLHIFAVESNYSKQLLFLENFYNITKTPSLIVNYDYKVSGKAQSKDVQSLLTSKD